MAFLPNRRAMPGLPAQVTGADSRPSPANRSRLQPGGVWKGMGARSKPTAFQRFLDWTERFRGRTVVFRGVEDVGQMWPVAVRSYFRSRGEMPGACDKRNLTGFRDYERALFTNFRREALLMTEQMPATTGNGWRWRSITAC